MVRWRDAGTIVVATAGFVACSSSNGLPADPTPDRTPAAVLQGPTWRLTTLRGQPVLEGTTVTAVFSSQGSVGGAAGCNSYSGTSQADAGSLKIGSLVSTTMACESDAVMQQEERYLAALPAATHYEVDGTQLRLGTSASDVTLVFTSR
jgi:heat shock protein HslJ